MKGKSLIMAILMVTSLGAMLAPASAHNTTDAAHGHIEVNEDVTVHPGWWGMPRTLNPQVDDELPGDEHLEWLKVGGAASGDKYKIVLSSTGHIVGRVDVFEYNQADTHEEMTPDCPWPLVSWAYPHESDESPFEFVNRAAKQLEHVRAFTVGPTSTTATVTVPALGPKAGIDYIVAVYVVAAEEASSTPASLTYDISNPDRSTALSVVPHDGPEHDVFSRVDLPYDYRHWRNTQLSSDPCFPDRLQDDHAPGVPQDAGELPTIPVTQSTSATAALLLDTHL